MSRRLLASTVATARQRVTFVALNGQGELDVQSLFQSVSPERNVDDEKPFESDRAVKPPLKSILEGACREKSKFGGNASR